jgi:hypothetical protein
LVSSGFSSPEEVEPVADPVVGGLGVPVPVGVEVAVPVAVGVEVAVGGDDGTVGGGLLVDPLGFSGVVMSLFAEWVILIVMVVSEYEDFLPGTTGLAAGLLDPLTRASAIAFSRLAGRPVADGEEVAVAVVLDAEDVEVEVGVAVVVSSGFGLFSSSCRLA